MTVARQKRRLAIVAVLVLVALPALARADPVTDVEVLAPAGVRTWENVRGVVLVDIRDGNNTTAYSGPVFLSIAQGPRLVFEGNATATNGTALFEVPVPCEPYPDDLHVAATVGVTQSQATIPVKLGPECARFLADQERARDAAAASERDSRIFILVGSLLTVVLTLFAGHALWLQHLWAGEHDWPSVVDGVLERVGFTWNDDPNALTAHSSMMKRQLERLRRRLRVKAINRILASHAPLERERAVHEKKIEGLSEEIGKERREHGHGRPPPPPVSPAAPPAPAVVPDPEPAPTAKRPRKRAPPPEATP